MKPVDAAVRFGGFVLAHAAKLASELRGKDLLCPFAIVSQDERYEIIPFEADTQEEAILIGQDSLEECKPRVDFWALARESIWSGGGEKAQSIDVLLISVWTHGLEQPVLLMQPFVPASSGCFRIIGMVEIAIEGEVQNLQRAFQLRTLALSGVERHPASPRWAEWLSMDTAIT